MITKKSLKLYKLYKENRLGENIKSRCCDFPLLEEKCDKFDKQKVSA